MVNDGQITFGLRDIRMIRWQCFFPDCEGAEMGFLGFAKSFLVCIKHREIVQDRGNVGMLHPEMSLINSQSMQVVRLRCFGAASFTKQQRRIVQESPEIRVGKTRDLWRS